MEGALKDIFSMDPAVVATQITLAENYTFKMIDTFELIGQKWNKQKKNAPNILRMINSFNNCKFNEKYLTKTKF